MYLNLIDTTVVIHPTFAFLVRSFIRERVVIEQAGEQNLLTIDAYVSWLESGASFPRIPPRRAFSPDSSFLDFYRLDSEHKRRTSIGLSAFG